MNLPEQSEIPSMALTNDPSKLNPIFEWVEVTTMDDFPMRRFAPTQLAE